MGSHMFANCLGSLRATGREPGPIVETNDFKRSVGGVNNGVAAVNNNLDRTGGLEAGLAQCIGVETGGRGHAAGKIIMKKV